MMTKPQALTLCGPSVSTRAIVPRAESRRCRWPGQSPHLCRRSGHRTMTLAVPLIPLIDHWGIWAIPVAAPDPHSLSRRVRERAGDSVAHRDPPDDTARDIEPERQPYWPPRTAMTPSNGPTECKSDQSEPATVTDDNGGPTRRVGPRSGHDQRYH